MENREKLIVEGFIFRSLEDVEMAKKEVEQISFLEERMDYSKPEEIMLIYKKILQSRIFHTPIGLKYLHKIRENLLDNYKGEEEIPNIMLHSVYQRTIREKPNTVAAKVESSKQNDSASRYKISMICNFILVLMIISMFYISLKGDNTTILNYEQSILNKYAGWEEELAEREEILRELENSIRNKK